MNGFDEFVLTDPMSNIASLHCKSSLGAAFDGDHYLFIYLTGVFKKKIIICFIKYPSVAQGRGLLKLIFVRAIRVTINRCS